MTEHRCYRGERCAAAHNINSMVREGATIPAARGLCPPCETIVADAITQLPGDYAELVVHLGDRGGGGGERVSGSPDPPWPLNPALLTLAEHTVTEATLWAEPVAERLNITWDSRLVDRHTRPGAALQRATRLLHAHLPVLLALPDQPVREWAQDGVYHHWTDRDGLDGAVELLRCHQQTRLYLRKTRLVHQLPAPCPSCDQVALVRYDGDDDVECRRCRRTWAYEDYDRLVYVLAHDAHLNVA